MSKTDKKLPDNRKGTGTGKEVTQFKKGVSGNPGGRPKKPEEFRAASSEARKLLIEKMMDEKTPLNIRLDIAKFIDDKVNGKACQSVDMKTEVSAEINNTIEFKGELDDWSK